jgi:hypothetical protein
MPCLQIRTREREGKALPMRAREREGETPPRLIPGINRGSWIFAKVSVNVWVVLCKIIYVAVGGGSDCTCPISPAISITTHL